MTFVSVRHGHLASLLLLLLASPAGCGDDDEPVGPAAEARTVFTSEGDGPTNETPVWPLRAGSHLDQFRLLPPVDYFGARAHRLVSPGPLGAFFGPGLLYLEARDDGVYLLGTTWTGPFPGAVLLVPQPARGGMAWQVSFGGDLVDVTGTLTVTPPSGEWGGRRLWHVRLERAEVTREAPDPEDAWELDLDLAEGAGLVGVTARVVGSSQAVVALDDTAVATSPALPELELEAIGDGPAIEGLAAMEVSVAWDDGAGIFCSPYGVCGPEHPGDERVEGSARAPRIRVRGLATDFEPDAGVDGFPYPMWQLVAASACVELDGDEVRPASGECAPGEATWVRPDGSSVHLPWVSGTHDPVTHTCYDAGGGEVCYDVWERAVFADAAGDARSLLGPFDGAALQRYDYSPIGLPDQLVTSESLPIRGLALPSARAGEPDWMRVAPTASDGVIVAYTLGAYGDALPPSHMGAAGLQADGTVEWRRPARLLPGRLTTAAEPGRQRTWATQLDGEVWRMVLDEEGARWEGLARVVVPAGHRIVGAFERGDDLVVVTHAGFAGFYEPSEFAASTDIEPGVGSVHLWKAALPDSAPVALEDLLGGVWGRLSGRDATVCAPEGTAAPLEGWTLDGEAPAAVVRADPASSCVLLVRSFDGERPELLGRAWVEGPLAGGGRVGLLVTADGGGVRNGYDTVAFGNVAPLAEGGWVDGREAFAGGGALAISAHRPEAEVLLPEATWADISGAGLWFRSPECQGGEHCVGRLDRVGVHRECTEPADPGEVRVPEPGLAATRHVAGGGFVMGNAICRPGGTYTILPELLGPGGETPEWLEVWAVLADETVCGQMRAGGEQLVFCTDPGGSTRAAAPVADEAPEALLALLPDGALLAVGIDLLDPNLGRILYVVDTSDMSSGPRLPFAALWPGFETPSIAASYAADGTPYWTGPMNPTGINDPTQTFLAVARLDREGMHPIELPVPLGTWGDMVRVGAVVDRDLVVVFEGGVPYRFPRR